MGRRVIFEDDAEVYEEEEEYTPSRSESFLIGMQNGWSNIGKALPSMAITVVIIVALFFWVCD
jgi:hypothetical protein